MKQVLIIKADTNDADYVHRITEVTPETIEELIPVIEAVKAKDGQWPRGEYADGDPEEIYEGILTPEQIDNFGGFCPYGEHGIHTIASIKVLTVVEEKRYL